jgi:hypothetical protein
LPALLLAVAAGCQGLGGRSKDGDPFLGNTPMSLQKEPPYKHPDSGSDTPPKPPPSPSSTHSLTSTATAAGQQPGSTDTGGTSIVPPPPAPAGATLAPPQALEGSTSRSGQWSAPVAVPQTTVSTFEQLQKQLEQRGMRYQWWQQVAETGEWKFKCSVLTDPRSPDLLTTYTQSSYGDCGVGAMRDVLQKIDQDRAKAR